MIPTTDQLRTLNLAYRKMQEDFQVFAEGLFRANENIATTAAGYLLLPNYLTELEMIVTTANTSEIWDLMDRELINVGTGYYWDGIDTASTGKRRLMVRQRGIAKASTTFTVYYLREYDDLTLTTSVPYPFVGDRYLDLLTTLQAYYWLIEQGDNRAGEAQRQYNIYKSLLSDVRRTYFDDNPVYGRSSNSDAGDSRRYPLLNPSTS